MNKLFGRSSKFLLEDIIGILEKRNGREFKEITVKHCKTCGAEVTIKELKEGHFGLLYRDCYNEYTRKYKQDRDIVRTKIYKKKCNALCKK